MPFDTEAAIQAAAIAARKRSALNERVEREADRILSLSGLSSENCTRATWRAAKAQARMHIREGKRVKLPEVEPEKPRTEVVEREPWRGDDDPWFVQQMRVMYRRLEDQIAPEIEELDLRIETAEWMNRQSCGRHNSEVAQVRQACEDAKSALRRASGSRIAGEIAQIERLARGRHSSSP